MIGWVHGVLRFRRDSHLIVDAGGVGYQVQVPDGVGAHHNLGDDIELHIHTHVREGILALFGFETEEELEAFERLITVSGVGPKLAVAIMGGISPGELATAIDLGDVPRLKKISGVGKKVAERLTMELRGKLRPSADGQISQAVSSRVKAGDIWSDLKSALTNLDYRAKEVESALAQLQMEHPNTDNTDFDNLLRSALALLRR